MESFPKKLGKYYIRSILGKGAMGIVYQGFDPDIQRIVAIKVLHNHLIDTAEGKSFRQRFKREAQAAAKCFHPNIVAVFELGEDNNRDFIVMEYVQGEELKYFLDTDCRFSQSEVSFIIGEVLKGLSAAHQNGVVHRDIKPANIILMDNGNIKIADFGVARLDNSNLTTAGNMVGTPSYMSPEGLRGKPVDFKADIYSTAMVLLELLTGRKPHQQELYSQSVTEFIDQVLSEQPDGASVIEYESLIRKGLADNKDDRFDSTDNFLSELKQVCVETVVDQRSTIEQLSETVVNLKPFKKEVSDTRVEWDETVLRELEMGLASYIGPLAKVLVKRSLTTDTTPEELISTLAEHLDDADEKKAFVKKAKKSISSGYASSDTAASGESPTLHDTLTPDQIDQISRKLAYYLGPLAKPLTIREARKHVEMDTFCQELATNISSQQEREAFLASVG